MTQLESGLKWAAVEFLNYQQVPKKIVSNGITEEFFLRTMFFKCGCGNFFDMPANKFKGRKVTRDCGCGLGAMERKGILSVYIPTRLLDTLDEMARANHEGNRSEAVAVALRYALGKWSGGGKL